MADHINTHSVGRSFAMSDDIVLSRITRTRTIFRPGMHGGGVRGHITRQKIGKDGRWADVNEANFTVLPADASVQIELDTEATQRLYRRLEQLYQV